MAPCHLRYFIPRFIILINCFFTPSFILFLLYKKSNRRIGLTLSCRTPETILIQNLFVKLMLYISLFALKSRHHVIWQISFLVLLFLINCFFTPSFILFLLCKKSNRTIGLTLSCRNPETILIQNLFIKFMLYICLFALKSWHHVVRQISFLVLLFLINCFFHPFIYSVFVMQEEQSDYRTNSVLSQS